MVITICTIIKNSFGQVKLDLFFSFIHYIIILVSNMKIIKWPLIYFLFQFILIFLLAYNYISSGNDIKLFNEFLNSKQIYLALILGIIFIPLLLKDYKKINFDKNNKINYFELVLIGVILSLIYNVFAYYFNFLLKTSLFDNNSNIIVTLISTGLIGPIIEELMFRGIIYNELKNKYSNMKAILITTAFFAIIHINVIQIIYTFALGFILIFVYEKYQNIKAPIILHMASNITTTLFLPILIQNNLIINYSIFLICLILIVIIKKYTKIFKM